MDIPKDLLEQIRYIEELFTVDATKLKAISDHFVSELAKGTNLAPSMPQERYARLTVSIYRS